MQEPNALLTTLSNMALKPEVTFDKLFQKLYNSELWLLAYQRIAPNPGNMTPGVDGKTIDGAGLKLIHEAITELKASRYKPTPTRRVYIPKPNGKQRPLGIPNLTPCPLLCKGQGSTSEQREETDVLSPQVLTEQTQARQASKR